MVDIEFIAQFLQLREAARRPQVLHQQTRAALRALEDAGALDGGAAKDLLTALALWRSIQSLLKLTVEEPFDEAQASPALRALLAKEKKIGEDEEKRALDEIQKMTDGEIHRMEELSAKKEAEVMQV